MRAKDARQMRLWVEVDAEGSLSAPRDSGEEIETGRGLADAAFLIEDRDDRHAPSLQDRVAAQGRHAKSAIIQGSCKHRFRSRFWPPERASGCAPRNPRCCTASVGGRCS